MTDRRITDAGVAGLPIHEGRAELLEEIMAIPTETHDRAEGADRARPGDELAARRRTRWLPVAGAAAAVAAIAGAVAVPQLLADEERKEPAGAGAPAAAPGAGEVAVLDAGGWTLTDASIDPEHGGELTYESGRASVDVHWRPAQTYDDYVADRSDIGPSEEVEVLGHPALLWSYARNDHTTIREVVGDFTLEVRGSGLRKPAYLGLLEQLTAIAPGELDAHLPDEFVTDDERDAVIQEMLAPLALPADFDPATVESVEIDRYQLGVDVVEPVACAWIRIYVQGDAAERQDAADGLGTSHDWPVLLEMAQSGDWPTSVWELADLMADGAAPRTVEEHAAGICGEASEPQ